jgi:hypothetical protein
LLPKTKPIPHEPKTLEEVERKMKEMASGKSPGIDGFTTDFFKNVGKYWGKTFGR